MINPSLYIWIPKCAGSSIYNRLHKSIGMQKILNLKYISQTSRVKHKTFGHISVNHLIRANYVSQNDIDRMFKFSFVRNPWDRLLSLWIYHQKIKRNQAHKLSFKEYAGLATQEDARIGLYNNRHFSQADLMYNHLYDDENKPLVNFVGRFENLQEDFNLVCDKIGIPRHELPHSNKTQHKHYAEYYDDKTRSIVGEKYAKDIEHFGYKFEEQ